MSRISSQSEIRASTLDTTNRAVFTTKTLVSNFDGKIQCITYYSSRVVIGSSDGRLAMYDTRKGTSSTAQTALYQFPNRLPVEQLIAIPHIRMLIVIADGQISAHGATDLQPLDFDFSKANAHSVRLVCVNQRGPPHFRLGVALLKRKAIVIYQYHGSDKSYSYLREFTTEDIPEAMAWYRNKMVVGYRQSYVLLNDKSGESTPIESATILDLNVFPVVKLLPKDEVLLSVMNHVGVSVNFNGDTLEKGSINWSAPPSHVEFTAPYVVGLIPHVGVEIHSTVDQSLVQLVNINRVICMFGNGMKWDMDPRPANDPEDVVVVGVRDGNKVSSVLKVEPMPMDQQIAELLDLGKIDEAHAIVRKSIQGLPSEKQRSKIKRFQRQATVALLRRLEFDAATDYMYKAAVEPCEYIAFFPEVHTPSFAYEPAIFKPEILPRGSSASPNIASVIDEILATQRDALSPDVSRKRSSELVKIATASLLKFLEAYKRHVREKSSKNSRSRSRSAIRSYSIASSNSSSSKDGSVSTSTVPKDARRAEAVDMALFQLYIKFDKRKDLLVLIEENNEVDGACLQYDICESLLRDTSLYYELGQFYASEGKFAESLDIYEKMHAGVLKQANNQLTPKRPIEAAINVLINLPEEQEQFVYEQSIWIMGAASPKQVFRIFTERKCGPMDSTAVVAHFKKHSTDPSIVQRYLETLVKNGQEQPSQSAVSTANTETSTNTPDVDNSYNDYLNSMRVQSSATTTRDDQKSRSSNDKVQTTRTNRIQSSVNFPIKDKEPFVAVPQVVDPHHTQLALQYLDEVLRLVSQGEVPSKSSPGKESGPLGDARKRLLRFLKSSSSHYDISALVQKVRNSPLYNEFIVLCGRGGLHEDAIRSLVYDLNDLKGAENYSLKYGNSAGSKASNTNSVPPTKNEALVTLLRICFNPEEEAKKASFQDFAFQVLDRHAKIMDGKAVLEVIPRSTPLHKLVEYCGQVLPQSLHSKQEVAITKSLSNIYNLQIQCARVERFNAHIEVDQSTVCLSCKKRVGDIVFCVYPNGNVVHYNCTGGKLDVCPITGEKFS